MIYLNDEDYKEMLKSVDCEPNCMDEWHGREYGNFNGEFDYYVGDSCLFVKYEGVRVIEKGVGTIDEYGRCEEVCVEDYVDRFEITNIECYDDDGEETTSNFDVEKFTQLVYEYGE